jgi:iron complex transport system ATP-binding protein
MLEARQLTFSLNRHPLIHQINLTFIPGILYGILGPNGSGKTTLLKTLAGIWMPTEGTVLWRGGNLLECDRRTISQIVTLVPQNAQAHFDFSVQEIVAMGLYTKGMKKHLPLVEEALHKVDAWHLRDRSILHLSHGERQRIYIARALATEAPILLLDEPTANLDIRHQLEIWKLLQELSSQGKIMIVTIHDLRTAERFCDEIAVLSQGKCIGKGSFSSVMSPQFMHQLFGIVDTGKVFDLA